MEESKQSNQNQDDDSDSPEKDCEDDFIVEDDDLEEEYLE